jgi:SPP1 family predicted phage head-tail adaptor
MGQLNSGQLDQRVVLLTPGPPVPDGRGGQKPSTLPDTETRLWAKVRPLSGRELLELGQTTNPTAYEVTIRKHPGVAVGQKVRWKGDTYNVHRLVTDTANEFHRLTCFSSGK